MIGKCLIDNVNISYNLYFTRHNLSTICLKGDVFVDGIQVHKDTIVYYVEEVGTNKDMIELIEKLNNMSKKDITNFIEDLLNKDEDLKIESKIISLNKK